MKRSKISQERSEFCVAKIEFVGLKTKGKMKLQRNLSAKRAKREFKPFYKGLNLAF